MSYDTSLANLLIFESKTFHLRRPVYGSLCERFLHKRSIESAEIAADVLYHLRLRSVENPIGSNDTASSPGHRKDSAHCGEVQR